MNSIALALMIAAAVIAVLVFVYLKGRRDEKNSRLLDTVDAYVKSKEKQEIQEVAHDKRVRDILVEPVDADKSGRMLSSWPDDTT